jgi:hypothetical protein
LAITDNNLAYYALDVDSSSQTDSSGNGNTATVNGATFTSSSKLGTGAYSFNGTSDYIDTNTNFDIETFACWFKTSSNNFSALAGQRFDASEEAGNWGADCLGNSAGEVRARLYSSSSSSTLLTSSSTGFDDGAWHLLILVSDGTNFTMYIDNSQEATVGNTGKMGQGGNDDDLMIGRAGQNGNWNYWEGDIDEVAVWSRSLSSDERSELWNSGNGFNPYTAEVLQDAIFFGGGL